MERVALHTICPTCEGHGRTSDHLDRPRGCLCFRCGGKGFVATEAGRKIIGLVEVARIEGLLPIAGV